MTKASVSSAMTPEVELLYRLVLKYSDSLCEDIHLSLATVKVRNGPVLKAMKPGQIPLCRFQYMTEGQSRQNTGFEIGSMLIVGTELFMKSGFRTFDDGQHKEWVVQLASPDFDFALLMSEFNDSLNSLAKDIASQTKQQPNQPKPVKWPYERH